MRILLLFISLWCSLFAAEINTKLYQGDVTELNIYYTQMQQEIEVSIPSDEASLERRKNEKILLAKLQALIQNQTKPLVAEDRFMGQERISEKAYLQLFNSTAQRLAFKQTTQNNQLLIQDKLSFLKHRIENMIKSKKENLRLYQLQFAYHKLIQSNDKKLITESSKVIEQEVGRLHTYIDKVRFDEKQYLVMVEKLTQEIQKYNRKLIALNLAKERELLSSDTISPKLKEKLQNSLTNRDKKLKKLIDTELALSLYAYQQNRKDDFLAQQKRISSRLNELSIKDQGYKAKYLLLKELQNKQLSSREYLIVRTKEQLQTLYSDFQIYLKEPLFVYDENPMAASDLLRALFILLVGFIIAKIYHRQFIKLHNRRKDLNTIVIKVIANLGFTVIFLIAFFMSMTSLGLSIANFAVIAGALSIGIGFALRSLVANYISGIVIMSEKNIKMGDFIRVDELRVGKVIDIGLRSTVIRTIDNTHIIMPNSDLIEKDVLNLTFNDRIRRIYVPFKIPYGSDINKIRTLIVDAVNDSDIKLLRDVYGKKPGVWMRNMGDSFIELDLFIWVEGYRASTKSNLLILIHETLLNNGIEMPNPQLDLHLKKNQKEILLKNNILGSLIKNEKSLED